MLNSTRLMLLKFVLSSALLMPMASLDAESIAKDESYVLDDVIIQAQRYEVGDYDPSLNTGQVKVIQLKVYEDRSVNLDEVLQKEMGTQVRRIGSEGSYATVSIRASSPNQVKVFMDGVPLSEGSGGGVDLSKISLDELERIEIYRGTAPAKFGVSPIGGAINLVTKRVGRQSQAQLKLGVGSFGTYKASLLGSRRWDKYSALFEADLTESEGDYDYKNDNQTPNDSSDDTRNTRINNDLSQKHFLIKLGYQPRKLSQWQLSHSYFDKEKGLPGRSTHQSKSTRWLSTKHMTRIQMNQKAFLGGGASASLYRSSLNEHYKDINSELGLGIQDNEYDSEEWGGSLYYEKFKAFHFIETKIEYTQESYESLDHIRHLPYPENLRKSLYANIQDSMSFREGTLLLVPALKSQFVKSEFEGQLGSAQIKRDDSETDLTWQFGLNWRFHQGMKLLANLGSAIRQPAFSELFGDRGVTIGNADLEAETSLNGDIGVSWDIEKNKIWENLNFTAVYFNSDRKNLIQFVFNARGIGKAQNISRADVSGFELSQQGRFFECLQFSQKLTLLDSTISESSRANYIGKQVPGIYDNTYQVRLEYDPWPIRPYYEYFGQDEMYYDRTNFLKAPTKNLHHVGLLASYKKMHMSFEVKNISDEHVEDFAGWPMPGRSYHFSFRAVF
ncbi:MAG: TonB-dependent receptor [Planctomycetes bacterium]|nr:TonB-dependent receptor [Planctomycetota bacterium]